MNMESVSMFHFAVSKWGAFISLHDKLKCLKCTFKGLRKMKSSEMSEESALIWG